MENRGSFSFNVVKGAGGWLEANALKFIQLNNRDAKKVADLLKKGVFVEDLPQLTKWVDSRLAARKLKKS